MFYRGFAIILSEDGQMERAVLQSTTLASAVYHAALRRLEIEFRTGTRYLYFRVPPECYREFLDAESKGLTSTATSATASPTNTCPMRPAPLSSPPVTKLSDIRQDCQPHIGRSHETGGLS